MLEVETKFSSNVPWSSGAREQDMPQIQGIIIAKKEKECSEGYTKLKGSRGRTLNLKHRTET